MQNVSILHDITRLSTEQLEALLGITIQKKLDARFPHAISEELVEYEGQRYGNKDREFDRFVAVPERAPSSFRVALTGSDSSSRLSAASARTWKRVLSSIRVPVLRSSANVKVKSSPT